MSEGPTTQKHKHESRTGSAAIITLSDSRTIKTDDSGILIKRLLEEQGHKVIMHIVIPDNKIELTRAITAAAHTDIIITDGGTGISERDITIETVKPLFTKELASFNPLFARLSYDDVGSAALLSRATAGIIGNSAVFCLPGSPKAVELAMKKIILPELGHIIKHMGG